MQQTQNVSVDRESCLEEIQDRVLWLSTNIIHHANKVRSNAGGIKVGGHQASSASMVTIMTSLFFDFMAPGDRIAVKPHASPVLHAIQYLLGNLDERYLTMLRQFHGLQAYPSRTKDPDPVDFSTGSVGLGSVAPNFASLAERFAISRFGHPPSTRRFISVVGDAELDEGSVWEAAGEPAMSHLDNLIWVVDLNRQSLDRVVPGIRVRQLEDMFRANGWLVVEAKYGRHLEQLFSAPGGEEIRRRIDEMPNEKYQFLLRSAPAAIRSAFGEEAVQHLSDAEVARLIADLGGHDFQTLRRAFAQADAAPGPAVVFAYTVKGWRLPIAGDPLNHSALISKEQIAELARQLEIKPGDEWSALPPSSPAGRFCKQRGEELNTGRPGPDRQIDVPSDLAESYRGVSSTQRAFGLVLTNLARSSPKVGERIVTVSPDVSTSTNLGGWINKVGVWSPAEEPDLFSTLGPRPIQWQRRLRGQHIELGISETNLFMLLSQLGLSAEMTGEPLLPIGTLYDPFVARALDAYIYGVYSGARFIAVGTPSGVTLAPEGGAHQSVITPSIGLALPNVVYYEPCFAQELEWILLAALQALHRPNRPESAYLRLSTAPIDQSLLKVEDRDALRARVLSGAYRIIDRSQEPGCRPSVNMVEIWATGVMVPQAMQASEDLLADGVYASVVNCLSPDLVYRRWRQSVQRGMETLRANTSVSPSQPPVVTVIDGHPSALAWIGSMLGARAWPLGVSRFGESGTIEDLYPAMEIDAQSICAASYAALSKG